MQHCYHLTDFSNAPTKVARMISFQPVYAMAQFIHIARSVENNNIPVAKYTRLSPRQNTMIKPFSKNAGHLRRFVGLSVCMWDR